jgi:hypothetical protein
LAVAHDVLEDYPHNFVLSALLYGGLLQTSMTLFLLGAALSSAWRAGYDQRILVFWLILLILFHSSSSNSIYSTELFLVLIALALDAVAERSASRDPSNGESDRRPRFLFGRDRARSHA